MGGQGDPLGIVQETEVWSYEQIVYAQLRIYPELWHAQITLWFWDTNGSPNLGQATRSYYNQQKKKKKKTCRIVYFDVPADHRVKLKECKKRDCTWSLLGNLKTVEYESDDYTNCKWCS